MKEFNMTVLEESMQAWKTLGFEYSADNHHQELSPAWYYYSLLEVECFILGSVIMLYYLERVH